MEILNVGHESGDLSEYDATGDNFTFLGATAAAAMAGSYGLHMEEGYGYTRLVTGLSGITEPRFGFQSKFGGAGDVTQWTARWLFSILLSDWSTDVRMRYDREASGPGAFDSWGVQVEPNAWVNDGANFSTDEKHWVNVHVRTGTGEDGVEVKVDGVTIYSNFTFDWSSISGVAFIQFGSTIATYGPTETGEYIDFDSIIVDDSTEVSEPGGAASAVPAVHNHLIMQGVH